MVREKCFDPCYFPIGQLLVSVGQYCSAEKLYLGELEQEDSFDGYVSLGVFIEKPY